ncbi:hypothetical protein ACFL6U_16790 [Planctomycetota bacterium]
MKKGILLTVVVCVVGCQSQSHYWFSETKSIQQAKWDLSECGEYAQSGAALLVIDPNGPSLFKSASFEDSMRLRGYQQVAKAELPENAATETMWLHLIPHNIAGVNWELPPYPDGQESKVVAYGPHYRPPY